MRAILTATRKLGRNLGGDYMPHFWLDQPKGGKTVKFYRIIKFVNVLAFLSKQ